MPSFSSLIHYKTNDKIAALHFRFLPNAGDTITAFGKDYEVMHRKHAFNDDHVIQDNLILIVKPIE